jgi:hypothetical protein
MTEVEEMPAREVAERLGLTANGVAQLAVRARAGLRDRYLQAHVRNHARPRCAYTVERLGAYVGGGLAPRDIAKVDQHLAGCADCADRLVEVEDVGSTLRRIALPLPLGLGAIAVKQLGLGLPSTTAGTARRAIAAAATGGLRRAVGTAVGAGALVAGLGGMAFVGPAGSAPQPVARPAAAAAVPAPDPSTGRTPPASTTPAAATTPEAPTVAPPGAPPSPPGGVTVPELPLPPLPPVHVGLPPVAPPVAATVGVAVGGVAVGAGVGPCTGVVAGPAGPGGHQQSPLTAGCPPSTSGRPPGPPTPPSGADVRVDVPGAVELKLG